MGTGTARAPKHQEILTIEGMRCGSCAIAVEALLKKQSGVNDAAVNFAADVATISWDNEKPDFAGLQHAVARLGYRLQGSIDPERSKLQAESVRKHLQRRLAVAAVFGMWSMMPAALIYLAPFGAAEPGVLWPLALASGLFAVPVILYSGSHFYRVGWRTLIAGAPGLDSLIFLAVFAACIISTWQLAAGSHHVYFDAAVMLITFQLIARLLDTSARISEICNLMPEQIRLDSNTPHIEIRAIDRELKTVTSKREIPLVGVALEAMRYAPNGFPHYRDRGELVSANLMKAFRHRNLFPTTDHVIYSFRHAFEDRMLEAGIDFGMRCYLMGHKNPRPDYGSKGSLEFRQELLMKIAHPYPTELVKPSSAMDEPA